MKLLRFRRSFICRFLLFRSFENDLWYIRALIAFMVCQCVDYWSFNMTPMALFIYKTNLGDLGILVCSAFAQILISGLFGMLEILV